MTEINNLPAHVLLVHFVVVLVPLTAALEVVCALWPAARRGQLLWLSLILAIITMVLTPITTNAGEWLFDLIKNPTPIQREHADRGGTMLYFAIALLVVALILVALRLAEQRRPKPATIARLLVAILAVAVAVASIVQIYRVGDSGAHAVWGNLLTHLKKAP